MVAAAGGDKSAADRLLPLVYEQLRKAAQLGMAGERAGHTLSATALVHEAYLKLVGPREVAWASRAHFYAAAAEAMRRILTDYARARGRQKRGPTPEPPENASLLLSVAALVSDAHVDQIVRLEEAVRRLEAEDPDVAQVVRLRFYAGLSGEETASALGKSRQSRTNAGYLRPGTSSAQARARAVSERTGGSRWPHAGADRRHARGL